MNNIEIKNERITVCKTTVIPNAKKYRNNQFSSIKRRGGRESAPFLGLPSGKHKVKFFNDRESTVFTVEVWHSPYGWAWRIIDPQPMP